MLTDCLDVLAHAVGQATPPVAMVLLDLLLVLGFGDVEPEEGALAVLFVLGEAADVHVAVLVRLHSEACFLVQVKLPFVYFACFVDDDAYI